MEDFHLAEFTPASGGLWRSRWKGGSDGGEVMAGEGSDGDGEVMERGRQTS